jgi:HTH-type transcriptional regulator/antitoxin HigA
MVTRITTKKEYKHVMSVIDKLMLKGEANLSKSELKEIERLSAMAEAWEDKYDPLKPVTIAGMIELKMFENRMKQRELAIKLGISATRLNEVLRGKRKVNIDLAKKLYEKLNIPADFILKHA